MTRKRVDRSSNEGMVSDRRHLGVKGDLLVGGMGRGRVGMGGKMKKTQNSSLQADSRRFGDRWLLAGGRVDQRIILTNGEVLLYGLDVLKTMVGGTRADSHEKATFNLDLWRKVSWCRTGPDSQIAVGF